MEWWRGPLASLVAGHKVIVVGGPAVTWTEPAALLRELGATAVLVVGTEGMGIGVPPHDADVVVVEREDHGDDVMAALHAGIRVDRRPPAARRRCGRGVRPRSVGRRDRQLPDRVTDPRRPSPGRPSASGMGGAGGQDPPRRPARSSRRRPLALHGRPDRRRRGAVAGARRRCWHRVGGRLHEWVPRRGGVDRGGSPTTPRPRRSLPSWPRRAETVRVMPFLEGIPTSIHGIVLPDGVVVLRPVELITLRRGRQLVYAGCGTYWDPPDAVRDEMRAAARTGRRAAAPRRRLPRRVHARRCRDPRRVPADRGEPSLRGRPDDHHPWHRRPADPAARPRRRRPLARCHRRVARGRAGRAPPTTRRNGGTCATRTCRRPNRSTGAAVVDDGGRWRWAADGEHARRRRGLRRWLRPVCSCSACRSASRSGRGRRRSGASTTR